MPEHFKLNTLSWLLIIVICMSFTYFMPHVLASHPAYGALKHDLGAGQTLTVDGSKRSIIYKGTYTCAEPAPDTTSSFATDLIASLSGEQNEQKVDSLLRVLSTPETQILFQRTQGIQAIRDGMFRLCEAQMNQAVKPDFYEEQMTDLLSTLNFIVPLELCINASTKMGELFTPDETKVSNPATAEPAELVSTYMNYCLNISQEYGLRLAENASVRREPRRTNEHQLRLLEKELERDTVLEEVRVRTYLEAQQQADLTD